ncbi:Type 1 glutamine amidotransferase-like domain-containing protein [Candidatus Pacearchaeota archaeon]|nr:Type 1 glutamine amidotransferase-like domain-containing protein [Candidatus Pacearchaeota archaeon]
MKLFLSGGGSGEDSIELDRLFVSMLDKSKPLLYIPIAIDTKKHPYPNCLKWLKSTFEQLGIKRFEMWTEKELMNFNKKDLETFSEVYIGGGNTFKLLKNLREFNFLDSLKNLAKKDIPIYGGSAGAIILTRTIIPALSADPNEAGLKEFDALNLVNNFDIFAHYERSQDKTILEYMKKYDLKKVIGIPENCGLFVTKDKIQVIGPGSAFTFNKEKKEMKPNSYI